MDIPPADTFSDEVRANSMTMKVFQDIDLPFVPDAFKGKVERVLLDRMLENSLYARLFSFVECGGYFCGSTFLAWLREKLTVKGILPTDTLADFARKTGQDLSVCASDTTDMELLVLNHRTAPGVPVANAVRMSMSIPFVWEEVVWREEWGTYMGREKKGNIIVDGGVLSNFPIRLVAATDDGIRQIMGDTDPKGAGNLGLMIDEKLPVPGAPDTAKTPLPVTRLRTVQRLSRLLETMTGASDNEMVRRYQSEICRLPSKGYGTLEFDMQGERLELFLAAARDAMERHLAQRPAV
jgi:predicted acylesterase/phospholipase RssA